MKIKHKSVDAFPKMNQKGKKKKKREEITNFYKHCWQ